MIKSTYEIIHNPKYQCGKCLIKTSESVREKVLSCSGKKDLKRPVGPFIYNSCPGNFFNHGYAQLLDVHQMFRRGVLASEGGVMDQSSKYIEVMNYIESLVATREIDQLKEQVKKKNGRK